MHIYQSLSSDKSLVAEAHYHMADALAARGDHDGGKEKTTKENFCAANALKLVMDPFFSPTQQSPTPSAVRRNVSKRMVSKIRAPWTHTDYLPDSFSNPIPRTRASLPHKSARITPRLLIVWKRCLDTSKPLPLEVAVVAVVEEGILAVVPHVAES